MRHVKSSSRHIECQSLLCLLRTILAQKMKNVEKKEKRKDKQLKRDVRLKHKQIYSFYVLVRASRNKSRAMNEKGHHTISVSAEKKETYLDPWHKDVCFLSAHNAKSVYPTSVTLFLVSCPSFKHQHSYTKYLEKHKIIHG